jgi:hypothetical protein
VMVVPTATVFERDAIASCYTPLRTAAPLLIPNFS